ncbi:MAG: transcriptional repressor LexA [bacterium]
METKKKILKIIRDFMEDHGYSPSIREIAKKLRFKSTKAVKVHLDALAQQGLIEKIAGQARSISIRIKSLPIVGRVTAGLPELAFEDVEGYFDQTKWRGCFLLKVSGDSMINAHIYDGDMVVVKPAKQAMINDIVVANFEGETTVKRLKKTDNIFILQPENKSYPVLRGQFDIIGKVIGVIRQV